jgi:hypothetical protein
MESVLLRQTQAGAWKQRKLCINESEVTCIRLDKTPVGKWYLADGVTAARAKAAKNPKEFGFFLECHAKKWIFAAETEGEMKQWLEAINLASASAALHLTILTMDGKEIKRTYTLRTTVHDLVLTLEQEVGIKPEMLHLLMIGEDEEGVELDAAKTVAEYITQGVEPSLYLMLQQETALQKKKRRNSVLLKRNKERAGQITTKKCMVCTIVAAARLCVVGDAVCECIVCNKLLCDRCVSRDDYTGGCRVSSGREKLAHGLHTPKYFATPLGR